VIDLRGSCARGTPPKPGYLHSHYQHDYFHSYYFYFDDDNGIYESQNDRISVSISRLLRPSPGRGQRLRHPRYALLVFVCATILDKNNNTNLSFL
jgi:hypothetical protein